MEYFDEKYYNDIWETVHRHDFCETRANEIIAKYGLCRILDIGTGCGHLVKVLREKRCDAWGLEISDYAIENTCCPGYIIKGSVTDIPFKDGRFDVIHSNGLWCYIKEIDVQKAAHEVYRVGIHQMHNIDTTDGDMPPEIKAVTFKPQKWWDEKIKPPKVLVACPTNVCKEYAMQRWINTVKNFTYPNFDIYLDDNSGGKIFWRTWYNQVNVGHNTEAMMEGDMCRKIAVSMEHIRRKFMNGDYSHWLNLEIDVIPESPDIIQLILKYGRDADWIAHTYPGRGCEGDDPKQSGVGCSMFSRNLMANINFNEAGYDKCPDAWLWDKIRPMNKYITAELWSLSKMKHIAA